MGDTQRERKREGEGDSKEGREDGREAGRLGMNMDEAEAGWVRGSRGGRAQSDSAGVRENGRPR